MAISPEVGLHRDPVIATASLVNAQGSALQITVGNAGRSVGPLRLAQAQSETPGRRGDKAPREQRLRLERQEGGPEGKFRAVLKA